MIQEVKLKDKTHYLILENYVVGCLRFSLMKVDLFGDDIGAVEYVSHMGTDLSNVNAQNLWNREKRK